MKDSIVTPAIEQLSSPAKLSIARQRLEKLHHRFPHLIDVSVFKELDRIAVNLEDDFTQQRSSNHLSQLAYSIALVRKKLSQEIVLLAEKGIHDIRLIPTSLSFTFGSKPVLGILAHAHLENQYEAFNEEHILLKIKKSISEAQLVKGSTYRFHPSQSTIKTLYFEIDKKSGLPFSSEEINWLKRLLKQEIRFCIEQLVPRIFMTRNEEEILKNILTLSREIHRSSDSPEVMILLDQQTAQEAIFTIIVVRISKNQPTISDQFAQIQGNFTYFPERSQIVRYLKKKYPIEANVFRIHLPKEASLLRTDLSVNFYLARQRISSLLTQAIGDFRDFNGGIILKQRESLATFIESFPDLSLQNPDLLENFFYSLVPIESQATLSLSSLTTLFNLFLEATHFDLTRFSDYFLKCIQISNHLFVMIRLPNGEFKAPLEQISSILQVSQSQIISSTLNLQNSHFLGYIIPSPQADLPQAILHVLRAWQQKVESRKILRLGFEYPIVSLDSRVGGDQMSSLILRMLSEGLMRENREGKIEYGIAKSVEISSDLKTYLFKLRPTRWSDGSMVTAFDFEYAWKKILSPSFKTPFAYLFYPIKNAELAKSGQMPSTSVGVQALDGLSLKVELKSPTPYFLELTALTIYSPVPRLTDQLHPNWPLEEGTRYICNGAFQLIKNRPNEGYELIKNPLYWDPENIHLDGISILKVNRHQALEMFEKNKQQWVGAPLMPVDSLFIPNEDEETVDLLSKSVRWTILNCEKPPFNHQKMRQAFSLSIDKKQLGLLFNAQTAISPLPARHSLIKPMPLACFDPKKAKALFLEALEELGLSKANFPPLTLVYLPGNIRTKLAEMLQHFWETTFSIQCVIEPLKWDVLFKKITEGDYQTGLIAWEPWVDDPMYTLNAFRNAKEPINFSKWENANYQEILHLAEREIETEKRQNYYLQAEQILLEELPVVPIFSNSFQALKKKSLKIKCSSNLINFKWAYFE